MDLSEVELPQITTPIVADSSIGKPIMHGSMTKIKGKKKRFFVLNEKGILYSYKNTKNSKYPFAVKIEDPIGLVLAVDNEEQKNIWLKAFKVVGGIFCKFEVSQETLGEVAIFSPEISKKHVKKWNNQMVQEWISHLNFSDGEPFKFYSGFFKGMNGKNLIDFNPRELSRIPKILHRNEIKYAISDIKMRRTFNYGSFVVEEKIKEMTKLLKFTPQSTDWKFLAKCLSDPDVLIEYFFNLNPDPDLLSSYCGTHPKSVTFSNHNESVGEEEIEGEGEVNLDTPNVDTPTQGFDEVQLDRLFLNDKMCMPISLVFLEKLKYSEWNDAKMIFSPVLQNVPPYRSNKFGNVSLALLVGPFLLTWTESGLCIPKLMGGRMRCYVHDFAPSRGLKYLDKEKTVGYTKEYTYKQIVTKLAQVVCHWNTTKLSAAKLEALAKKNASIYDDEETISSSLSNQLFIETSKKRRKSKNLFASFDSAKSVLGSLNFFADDYLAFTNDIMKYVFELENPWDGFLLQVLGSKIGEADELVFYPSTVFQEIFKLSDSSKKEEDEDSDYTPISLKIVFKTHRQLDLFVVKLKEVDMITYETEFADERQLLKCYDRIFWLRHIGDPKNQKWQPLEIRGGKSKKSKSSSTDKDTNTSVTSKKIASWKKTCPFGNFTIRTTNDLPLVDFAPTVKMDEESKVLPLLRKDGLLLRFCSTLLQDTEKVVKTAIGQNGKALKFSSLRLRQAKEVVMMSVRQDGNCIRYAEGTVRNDRDIVMAAVRQDGTALRYCSEKYRKDEEVAVTAVSNSLDGFFHVSPVLRNSSKAVVMAAIKKDFRFLYLHAGREIRRDPEILLEFLNQFVGEKFGDLLFEDLKKRFSHRVSDVLFEGVKNSTFRKLEYDQNQNVIYVGFCKAEKKSTANISRNLPDRHVPHGFGFELMKKKGTFLGKTKFQKVFVGEFDDGLKEGEGTEFDVMNQQESSSNILFQGHFKAGLRDGVGREFDVAKGLCIYEGAYKDGVKHGRGEMYDPDHQRYKNGVWKDGEMDESEETFSFEFPILKFSKVKEYLSFKKREDVIGSGTYGEVFRIPSSMISQSVKIDTKSEKHVALKVFKKMFTSHMSDLASLKIKIKSLCEICARLERKNQARFILKTYCVFYGATSCAYAMPLCRTSVDIVILNSYFSVPMKEKIRIMYQTSLGMKSLHSLSCMHRDMKWGNVLLDFNNEVKITDLESLREDQTDFRLSCNYTQKGGTACFFAPERLSGKYGISVDVYSFGLMIYSLLFEQNNPFFGATCPCGQKAETMDDMTLIEHVSKCHLRPMIDKKKKSLIDEEYHFLFPLAQLCWDPDPKKRPTFAHIVEVFEKAVRKEKTYAIINVVCRRKKFRILLLKPTIEDLKKVLEKRIGHKVVEIIHGEKKKISSDEDVIKLVEDENQTISVIVELKEKKEEEEEEEEIAETRNEVNVKVEKQVKLQQEVVLLKADLEKSKRKNKKLKRIHEIEKEKLKKEMRDLKKKYNAVLLENRKLKKKE